jgi:hypothetical protein
VIHVSERISYRSAEYQEGERGCRGSMADIRIVSATYQEGERGGRGSVADTCIRTVSAERIKRTEGSVADTCISNVLAMYQEDRRERR